MILCSHLENSVHLVKFEPGLIELRILSEAPQNLVNRVSEYLTEWTGQRWLVTVSGKSGQPTLNELTRIEDRRLRDEAESDELVRAVKLAFPGAKVTKVTKRQPRDLLNEGFGHFDYGNVQNSEE